MLFVCVHNCRAAARWRPRSLDKLGRGSGPVRSAGSDPADELNPNVIEAMEEVGVDISARSSRSHSPTRSSALPTW